MVQEPDLQGIEFYQEIHASDQSDKHTAHWGTSTRKSTFIIHGWAEQILLEVMVQEPDLQGIEFYQEIHASDQSGKHTAHWGTSARKNTFIIHGWVVQILLEVKAQEPDLQGIEFYQEIHASDQSNKHTTHWETSARKSTFIIHGWVVQILLEVKAQKPDLQEIEFYQEIHASDQSNKHTTHWGTSARKSTFIIHGWAEQILLEVMAQEPDLQGIEFYREIHASDQSNKHTAHWGTSASKIHLLYMGESSKISKILNLWKSILQGCSMPTKQ